MRKYYLIILVSFIGCNSIIEQNQSNTKLDSEKNDTLSLYLSEWKKDSLGCLHLRSYNTSQYIIQKLSLDSSSIKDVMFYLGSPNAMVKDSGSTRLTYYFGTSCNNNKIVDSIDFCWVRYVSKNGTIKYIDHTCL